MDGGGFDLDGGVTDSTLQFNKSYGNDGAGYGLYNYDRAGLPWGNNVVRYNASYGDGRKNNYGAITFYSNGPPFGLVTIFGNRIFLRRTDDRGKAIRFWTAAPAARVYGNKVLKVHKLTAADQGIGKTILNKSGSTLYPWKGSRINGSLGSYEGSTTQTFDVNYVTSSLRFRTSLAP